MIDITIRITGDELGEVERNVLAALTGQPLLLPRLEEPTVDQQVGAGAVIAAQLGEQPKRTRRTKAEMEAARAAEQPVTEEPVTEEPVTEEPVTEEPVTEPTLADAVKMATELVAANRVGELRTVLTEMGAKRVSELKGDQIGVFLGKFAA
jgi:hypothetical protein